MRGMDERRNDWPLYDPQLMLAIAGCLIAITFVLLIALLKTRVRRAEFAQLQRNREEMSEHVKELQAAEQLRFLKEIKASKKDDELGGSRLNLGRSTQGC